MPTHSLSNDTRTLTRHDYLSDEVYELERQRLFHGGWMFAARADTLQRGNRTVVDLAGESVLITRDLDGSLHAFANVCRHRGARLCDQHTDTGQGSLMCPYHAWTYALDGRLIATPHLDDSDVDKASHFPLDVPRERMAGLRVRQSLAEDPPPFDEWMTTHCSELLSPRAVQPRRSAGGRAHQRLGSRRQLEDHHRELPGVPALHAGAPRTGRRDPALPHGLGGRQRARRRWRGDGRRLQHRLRGRPPDAAAAGLDEVDRNSYYGGTSFPNMFVDISGTCAVVTSLFPKGPNHTTMVMEFMFAPDVIADPALRPARRSSSSTSSSPTRTTWSASVCTRACRRGRSPTAC